MSQQWETTVTIQFKFRDGEEFAERVIAKVLAQLRQHGSADVLRIDTKLVRHHLGFLRRRS